LTAYHLSGIQYTDFLENMLALLLVVVSFMFTKAGTVLLLSFHARSITNWKTTHGHMVAEEENYSTRSMANNIIKINCHSVETYRKMIAFMKENIIYHSYQPKTERPYRVFIKHLHHSVEIEDITDELSGLGHKVRNIINSKHQTIEPLNLFFIDFEPSDNSKEVCKIKSLQNKIIEIEPPNKSKHIIQCTRCQLYGHSKKYCNRPYLCV
jgi:hypothetical protein